MSTETKEVKKRRGTSLPLLIAFLILGVIGYYAGPTILTYAFYLQEAMIASWGNNVEVPVGITPNTAGDPNVGVRPGADGPGAKGPDTGGPSASGSDAAPNDPAPNDAAEATRSARD
jgi:hypothetical protein